jgi:peptidoglycan biosynthesis protein MviN/MurJ (putative lipid II flippase)
LASLAVLATLSIAAFSVLDEPRLRVAGLAIAHVASYALVTVAGFVILRRRIAGFDARPLAVTLAKSASAAVAAGAAAWSAAGIAEDALGTEAATSQLLQVVLSVGAGVLFYAVVTRVLGAEELSWLRSALARGNLSSARMYDRHSQCSCVKPRRSCSSVSDHPQEPILD